MERLDIHHHQLIMTFIILVVFITGIVLGIKLSAATAGTDGMEIITFALSFLSIVITFLIFTQLVHIRNALAGREKTAQQSTPKRK